MFSFHKVNQRIEKGVGRIEYFEYKGIKYISNIVIVANFFTKSKKKIQLYRKIKKPCRKSCFLQGLIFWFKDKKTSLLKS
jgi:hypothetical protein